jgi:predicted N-acetyltransferase YhbS
MVALTALPPTSVIDGPRPALPSEVPDVIALVDAAMRTGSDQSMLTDYPLVYAPENLRNVMVLRADGELVSTVPVLPRAAVLRGRRIRVGIISPTATAPAHQHRGYASRCLESAIAAMADAGCALSVLWTLVETFPFYERAGYHPVPFQGVAFPLRSADASVFAEAPGVTVAWLDPEDERARDAIRAMHDRDADGEGIRRDARETAALFALPKVRTLVASRAGEPVAYLVVSEAINKPGLIEAGGEPTAIETLLREALAALPPGVSAEAHALRTPTIFGDLLERLVPHRRSTVEAAMMVRVNDVEAVLGGRPPFELATHEWAAVLFGSHPARVTAASDLGFQLGLELPLDLPIPVLDGS